MKNDGPRRCTIDLLIFPGWRRYFGFLGYRQDFHAQLVPTG
jgi:hypothetical protein